MAFDYKKEYKEYYMPKAKPEIIEIPPMNYIAVRGVGDPNEEGGAYKAAIGQLYGIAFTLKMSKKGSHQIEGYFDYVVPPLEGFWQQGQTGTADKAAFRWVSVARLPDFVTEEELCWAKQAAWEKKKLDCGAVEFLTVEEGLCVQCMHIGPYDDEPKTIEAMHEHAAHNGYVPDIRAERMHHEIYLSDPRKCAPERLKTVVRHPVKLGER